MSDLPACKDFIIPALRALRMKSSKLKDGTAGGTTLQKLFQVAGDVYSKTEIRRALATLMKHHSVVVIAYQSGKGKTRLNELPVGVSFDENYWYFDANGKPLMKSKDRKRPEDTKK
jgi:hypothetical protein